MKPVDDNNTNYGSYGDDEARRASDRHRRRMTPGMLHLAMMAAIAVAAGLLVFPI